MSRLAALLRLMTHFFKDLIVSGATTAGLILRGRRTLRPGLVRMSYGDLPDGAALAVGALITLTPGTSTVDIDAVRREYLLHLLDLDGREATLATIRRDLIEPVRILAGVRR